MYNGIININKPAGITSHTVVSRLRKLFGMRRIGHAGTLDPLASGVLPIMLGSATKLSEILMGHDKTYRVSMRLGVRTDTQDITGSVIYTHDREFPAPELVLEVAGCFTGEIEQIPPMYSAVKVNGRKLYEAARNGIEIERKPRRITVYGINFLKYDSGGDYTFETQVSKGTYIRTLCDDIGQSLGCGAVMTMLERIRCGSFGIDTAVPLDDLEACGREAAAEYITAPEDFLSPLCAGCFVLTDRDTVKVRNGSAIGISDESQDYNDGSPVLICGADKKPFALGKILRKDGNSYLKAWKYL